MTSETIGKLCVSRHGTIVISFNEDIIKIRDKEMTLYTNDERTIVFITNLDNDVRIEILKNRLIKNVMLRALQQELAEYTCISTEVSTYKELIDTLNKLVELIDRAFGK